MNDRSTRHLSEDEFAELLASAPAEPWVAAHVHACRECQEQLGATRFALESFAQHALEAGERRAHAIDPARIRAKAAGWRLEPLPLAGAAAAAALALAVWSGHSSSRLVAPAEPAQASAPAAHTHNPAELARDNQLLTNIDTELRWKREASSE